MSKQKDSTKQVTSKGKTRYLRNFILLMLVYGLGLFLFQQSQMESKQAEDSPDSKAFSPDDQLVDDALNNEYSVGAEPPILRFAPKEMDENSDLKEDADLDKISDLQEEHVSNNSPNSLSKNSALRNRNLKEYRLYLQNANKLMQKFQLDKEYDFELQLLESHQLPSRVEEIVSLLNIYNDILIKGDSPEGIKFLNSELLSQFVSIKKMPDNEVNKKELKEKIQDRLSVLIDYVFSSELQNNFLEVDGL